MQAAVDSCGGSFTGGSVDDLVRAWGERTKKAALHPWKGARNSTGGGGNGGGGNDHPRDQGRGPSPGAGGAAVPAGQRAGA